MLEFDWAAKWVSFTRGFGSEQGLRGLGESWPLGYDLTNIARANTGHFSGLSQGWFRGHFQLIEKERLLTWQFGMHPANHSLDFRSDVKTQGG